MSSYQIAEQLGTSQRPVLQALRERGVKRRNPSVRRTAIQEGVFDAVSPEMLYWLGFLYADGSISGNRITLALQERDVLHLEKFKQFLGISNDITGYMPKAGQRVMRVSTRSQHIVDRLHELGMDKKQPPLLAREESVDSRDFWRGMVDGDGTIMITSGGVVRLVLNGNQELVEQFSIYCGHLVESKAQVVKHSSISRVSYSGKYARTLIAHFYQRAVVSLDRKQVAANAIIERSE